MASFLLAQPPGERKRTIVMSDVENFHLRNYHLKYHDNCKYHDISKLVVTVQQTLNWLDLILMSSNLNS